MVPTSTALLFSARRAIAEISRQTTDAATGRSLADVNVLLNEVLLRDDAGFFDRHLAEGISLIEEGQRLVSMPLAVTPAPSQAQVSEKLELVARTLTGEESPETADFLERAVNWEVALYRHRMTQAIDARADQENVAKGLEINNFQQYLRQKFPSWKNLKIISFDPLPGGFSKITILVETIDDLNGPQSLVIRAEPPLRMVELDGIDLRCEFPVIEMAFRAGIPVAEPLWIETDTAPFGMRFVVSKKAEGRVYGTVKGTAERISEYFLQDLAKVLAALHAVDLSLYPKEVNVSHLKKWVGFSSIEENNAQLISYWEKLHLDADGGTSIIVHRGLKWLARNVPSGLDGPAFLHGDVGLHNILVLNDQVSALLDWEVSRFGDPAEDITNLLSGTSESIDRDAFLRYYSEFSGRHISDARLRWFDVYHAVKQTICALASLRCVEDNSVAPIGFSVFGLQYLYYITDELNEKIKIASLAA